MQLADKSAVVAFVGQKFCDKNFLWWELVTAIAVDVKGGRVASCEECGAAWGADRALRVGAGKRDAPLGEPVEIGCPNVGIPQAADRVKPLLVGAVPEYIGSIHKDILHSVRRRCQVPPNSHGPHQNTAAD